MQLRQGYEEGKRKRRGRLPTCDAKPMLMSMTKKRTDHSCGRGRRDTAAGYTMKAKPEPEEATSFTSTPSSCARKPRMLKMTKPEKTEVEQLEKAMMMASLGAGGGENINGSSTESGREGKKKRKMGKLTNV